MRRTSTVVLSYPPASSVWHLPMGIGYLAGILQQDGHEVIQEYGYIKAVEHVLRHHGGPEIGHHLQAIRDPETSIPGRYDARMAFHASSQNLGTIETFVVERNNVRCDSKHFKGSIDELLWVLDNRTEHVFFDYFAHDEVPRAAALRPDIYGISVADERQLVSA